MGYLVDDKCQSLKQVRDSSEVPLLFWHCLYNVKDSVCEICCENEIGKLLSLYVIFVSVNVTLPSLIIHLQPEIRYEEPTSICNNKQSFVPSATRLCNSFEKENVCN